MKNVIGENIKRLRKQQEIKQAVLAAKLNIGRQTLSAYERGVTLPDVLALIEIADYFGVSLDELTGRLRADGYAVVSGPRTTGDGYYESCVEGPEGNLIEITE